MESELINTFDASKTELFEEEHHTETNIAMIEITEDLLKNGLSLAAFMVKNILSLTDFKFHLILKIQKELRSVRIISLLLQFFYSIQPAYLKEKYSIDFDVLLHDRANFERINKISNKKIYYNYSILKDIEEIKFKEDIEKIELESENHFEDFELTTSLKNLVETIKEELEKEQDLERIKFSKRSCIGGTFDHIHLGHKLFLSFGVLCSEYLLVGVTAQEMLKKKSNFYLIEPNSRRRQKVARFLSLFDRNLQFDVVEITDGLGPYKERN